MPFQEASFWVSLETFILGLYLLIEGASPLHFLVGLALTIVGAAGIVYSVVKNEYPDINLPHVTAKLWVPLGLLSLAMVAYEAYLEKFPTALPKDLPSSPPFLVSEEYLSPGYLRPGSVSLWVANDHKLICPVYIIVFFKFERLQPGQTMISQFKVEMKTTDERWVRLGLLDTHTWKPYVGNDRAKVHLIDGLFVDRQIVGHMIAPQNVVRGWAFYDYPETENINTFTSTLKLTLSDTSGKQFVFDPVPIVSPGIQPIEYTIAGGVEDFSHVPTAIHCGEVID